jgi:hypothetical protein
MRSMSRGSGNEGNAQGQRVKGQCVGPVGMRASICLTDCACMVADWGRVHTLPLPGGSGGCHRKGAPAWID